MFYAKLFSFAGDMDVLIIFFRPLSVSMQFVHQVLAIVIQHHLRVSVCLVAVCATCHGVVETAR